MNRGLSNTTAYQRPYGIVKGVCISRLPITPIPIRRYSVPRPSAVFPPPPPSKLLWTTKKATVLQPKTPLEYISCPCPDSHQPSPLVLRCQAAEPHVMVMPKNFTPPPPEEPIDWKLMWKLNKLSRPRPPKNKCVHFEWVYNAVGEYEAFTVPITRDENGPLEHHYMKVFPEMIMKVKSDSMKRLTDMIQGLLELAIDSFVIKKLLDDVEKYKVTKDEDPVNVFDTICRYTYVAATSRIDDASVLYKILVIIKQDVVNLRTQLGMKKAERQWFVMLNNLVCVIHDNAMNKIAAEIEHMEMQLLTVRNNIRDAGDEEEGVLWKEFAELKSSRNDLIVKKKKLLTVLL